MKYTRDQLRDMAKVVVANSAAGGVESFQLYMFMSFVTRLQPNEVRARIQRLAGG